MEDFVPFEIAEKLKEKGFREKCLLHYTSNGGFYFNSIDTYDIPDQELDYSDFLKCYNNGNSIGLIDAPTAQQVLNWFRKEFKIHVGITSSISGYDLLISRIPEEYGANLFDSLLNYDGPNINGSWDDIFEAKIYGINYVLDKLI